MLLFNQLIALIIGTTVRYLSVIFPVRNALQRSTPIHHTQRKRAQNQYREGASRVRRVEYSYAAVSSQP
jgi:hypothetical protein